MGDPVVWKGILLIPDAFYFWVGTEVAKRGGL